ncbi:hypothetical protein LNQ49_07910 [Flavobacterium sp. F-65]|jgi:hypothetical protein|uniref:Lipoprotein n=1 Tax=Flavobacterium pisciphilum TaxID=2893755 RepID=A0ABS8MTJ4_9FLAO|nr:DUF5074 domain-containing protein [Flavobacterium sp. F-65]MCC9071501.1 hypothetical protein [Flavobacterium sp. F-65]
MKFSKLFLIVLSVSLFVSCSNDDNNDSDDQKGAYDNGILILNEGSAGQGSVSFIDNNLNNFVQDIYTAANPKDLMGKYAQNIFFDGDRAYIIAGGSNVINVVNRYTFKLIAKIETGLKNPRYGVVKDGKAYVTNANTYYSYEKPEENPNGNTDDYVAVINLATNAVESKIELNATANRILLEDGKLYITEPLNNDKLLIVNIADKKLETPIIIGLSSDTMEEENGIIYILRGPYDGTRSEITKVKISDKTTSKIEFPASLDGAGNLDIYENKIYYTAGSSVYAMNLNDTTASTTTILTSSAGYLYGFAVKNNHIFVADGGNFKSDSKAYIYSLTGTLQKELVVGIGPNGFYFND